MRKQDIKIGQDYAIKGVFLARRGRVVATREPDYAYNTVTQIQVIDREGNDQFNEDGTLHRIWVTNREIVATWEDHLAKQAEAATERAEYRAKMDQRRAKQAERNQAILAAADAQGIDLKLSTLERDAFATGGKAINVKLEVLEQLLGIESDDSILTPEGAEALRGAIQTPPAGGAH